MKFKLYGNFGPDTSSSAAASAASLSQSHSTPTRAAQPNDATRISEAENIHAALYRCRVLYGIVLPQATRPLLLPPPDRTTANAKSYDTIDSLPDASLGSDTARTVSEPPSPPLAERALLVRSMWERARLYAHPPLQAARKRDQRTHDDSHARMHNIRVL